MCVHTVCRCTDFCKQKACCQSAVVATTAVVVSQGKDALHYGATRTALVQLFNSPVACMNKKFFGLHVRVAGKQSINDFLLLRFVCAKNTVQLSGSIRYKSGSNTKRSGVLYLMRGCFSGKQFVCVVKKIQKTADGCRFAGVISSQLTCS